MICTCKDVITCITKILFPFTTGLPYVELLPQRKYNAKNPDSSFNCMSFWNRTNVSLFRCLIHDSRKKKCSPGLLLWARESYSSWNRFRKIERVVFMWGRDSSPCTPEMRYLHVSPRGIYSFYLVLRYLCTCFISPWGQDRPYSDFLTKALCRISALQMFIERINIVF